MDIEVEVFCDFPIFYDCDFDEVTMKLLVPLELYGKTLKVGEFIEKVAEYHEYKVLWVNGGRAALMYRGSPDEEVKKIAGEFRSEDKDVRFKAILKSFWAEDPRLMPFLLEMTDSKEYDVAGIAAWMVNKQGWCAAFAMDVKKAYPALKRFLGIVQWRYGNTPSPEMLGAFGGEALLSVIKNDLTRPKRVR